jgi:hypothetical protein
MSIHEIGDTYDSNFTLVKRIGVVEMEHNFKTGTWNVFLYPKEKDSGHFILHTTTKDVSYAHDVFNRVVSMIYEAPNAIEHDRPIRMQDLINNNNINNNLKDHLLFDKTIIRSKYFCWRCGQARGAHEGIRCVGINNDHEFLPYSSIPICSRCGKMAGVRNPCDGDENNRHDFLEI